MDLLEQRSTQIKQKAIEIGFSACGITLAQKLLPQEQHLRSWLSNGYYGEMNYLSNHFEKRLDPSLLVPNAKSVIVVLLNYFPESTIKNDDALVISKYAYGIDYHIVIKQMLNMLFDFISTEIEQVEGRCFVDSAPVLERTLAVNAGLGWIGKNGLLLTKELGSFVFIGELVVDMELKYDRPFEKNYCGTCTNCLDACPTKAFISPSVLDARKCISYLTIELKNEIPTEYESKLETRIYGCDACQDVCPWNRNLKATSNKQFAPLASLLQFKKDDWLNCTPADFNRLTKFSAMNRTGISKMKKNVRQIDSKFQNK